jgi:hypothetical protein
VAAALSGYRREGQVQTRLIRPDSRLVEWRWVGPQTEGAA